MGLSFGKGLSGQEWFQWVRGLYVHRYRAIQRSKWSDGVRVRIPTIWKLNVRTSEATKRAW